MTMPSLEIAIFSYNRGAYLENCVTSVVRNMPGIPYLVYDDGSDDSSTLSYLHRLGNQVRHMKSASDAANCQPLARKRLTWSKAISAYFWGTLLLSLGSANQR